ncbi:DUF4097 family beta strand repeat-containing protein [Paenibacillus protaetiae]|uniref:DUF4097 family beta strand repeat-containing protein n=1 Tax=Paenibacillus protaetiae TaxID=2509456 RepID=UPI001FC90ABD|nr:hypothetical protein [Paenibacillus protaetiae]
MKLRWVVGVILVLIGVVALLQNQFGGTKSKEYDHTLRFDGNLQELAVATDSLGLQVDFVKSTDGSNSIHLAGKAKQEIIDQINAAKVENGRLNLRLKEKWHFGLFDFSGFNDKQIMTVSLTDEAMQSLETLKLVSDSGSVRVAGEPL